MDETPAANRSTTNMKSLGTTNDVTTCDCCGRDDLKRTVILGVTDADGCVMSELHYGTECAARALAIPAAKVRRIAALHDAAVIVVRFNAWTVTRKGGAVEYRNVALGGVIAPEFIRPTLRANMDAAVDAARRSYKPSMGARHYVDASPAL